MRITILILALLPYAYFGLSDLWHHGKQQRLITYGERVLHGAIGLSLLALVPHALAGHREIALIGVAIFVAARTLDEFVFHRDVGGEEADLHAKTHLGFLIFVVAMLAMDWYETAGATNPAG